MSAINISDTLIDFFVDVKENRDIKVLQITDTQIIDASQIRDARHLSSDEDVYWSKKSIDEHCFNTVREGKKPFVEAKEGLRALKIAYAAIKSFEEGKRVYID